MMFSQVKPEYEKLKSDIITKTDGVLNFEKIKQHFTCIINSKRKLSKIKNLKDIIHLLEERDALDCWNVAALKDIGKLSQNEEIINLVNLYDKLHGESKSCCCGKNYKYILPIINDNPERDSCLLNVSNELREAVNNVSRKIGKNWRVLASELGVKECHVDEVRSKYPNDYHTQALKILEVWIKDFKEEATLDKLKCTLENRLCKKKGLGVHVMNPEIRVE